jgi:hypothetical protein
MVQKSLIYQICLGTILPHVFRVQLFLRQMMNAYSNLIRTDYQNMNEPLEYVEVKENDISKYQKLLSSKLIPEFKSLVKQIDTMENKI